ncbi:MAG: tRNA (adenosine(37)-N6)-threonylcarbamoyltransferase complex dimerization subunit type 1 TsaB [Flavobacteriales bacterium]
MIETSTRICSAGIYGDGKLVAHKILDADTYVHAESLMPCIHQVIAQAGVSTTEIDAVVIGEGPGSYTGLRIGTSLAKGICFGLKIPLYAVDSGQMFALYAKQKFPSKTRFVSMTDAGRMEVYMAVYDQDINCISEHQPMILDEAFFRQDEFRDAVFVGDGIEKASHWMIEDQTLLIAETNVKLMSLALDIGIQHSTRVADFVPLYVKSYTPAVSKKALP